MRRAALLLLLACGVAGCRQEPASSIADLNGGDPAKLPRATAVLAKDPSAEVTSAIVAAAGGRNLPAATRIAALGLLPDRHLSGAIAILRDRVHDPEPEVRKAAIAAMVAVGSPQALDWLDGEGKSDADPGVRQAVADASAKLHAGAADWYLAILDDDAAALPLRQDAANVLGALKDPKAVTHLEAFYPKASTSGETRQAVLWALGDIGTPEALAFVRAQLRSPGVFDRGAAIYVAGQHHDADAVADLTTLLKEDSLGNRTAAARALGLIGGPDATAALKAELTDAKLDPQLKQECRNSLKAASLSAKPRG